VNNEMFRLDFNHGHGLVQIEKLKAEEPHFWKLRFLNLVTNLAHYEFGCKMSLGVMATKLVAKLSSARIKRNPMI
jgi:hypothetical protein